MKPQTYTPNDVGCYADGSRGIYLTDFVVEFANDHGAAIEHECKGTQCAPVKYSLEGNEYWEDVSFAYCEFSSEYGDDATDYMNEHYPVEGCYWAFNDGDWGLWTDSDD